MASASQNDFYADPAVYDILHTPGTAAEVDGLLRIARLVIGRSTRRQRWLEPACGTARYLRVLARRGVRVVGFDGSAAMIAYARQRCERLGLSRRAMLFEAEMTRFARQVGSQRIDFAFNLINTIRHLESDDAMLRHFAEMARVLKPDGVYAVGLSLTRYGLERPSEDIWKGVRGRCWVREVVRYEPPAGRRSGRGARRQRVLHRVVIERPSGIERRRSSYGLRCYDQRQWNALLARSRLERIATVDEVGDRLEGTWSYQIELLRRRPRG